MAVRRINCDKTEIIVMVEGRKRVRMLNLTYEQITRIQFDKFEERRFLFFKVPSEKITIVTGKRNEPIVYTKMKEKKYFDQYKEELRKFVKDNSVSFVDNT
ncbi:MAG: hypothetical protein MJB12_18445 [Firmicutes bacterium]|nr:hypothetical protein [Bacillota bacterium]